MLAQHKNMNAIQTGNPFHLTLLSYQPVNGILSFQMHNRMSWRIISWNLLKNMLRIELTYIGTGTYRKILWHLHKANNYRIRKLGY